MEVQGLWEAVLPRLQHSIASGLKVEAIAEHCHVSVETVHGWIENKHPAKGERMIRLWHLMNLIGHPSPELDGVKPYQRLVSELVGLDVIGVLRACEIFNTTPDKPSHVYHILRGAEVLKPRYTYVEVDAMYSEELQQMRQIIRENLAFEPVELPQPDPVEHIQQDVSSPVTVPLTDNPKFMLASLIGAMLPLARALESDRFTPQDRSDFRELVGSEVLFEVTNLFASLSSERARKATK